MRSCASAERVERRGRAGVGRGVDLGCRDAQALAASASSPSKRAGVVDQRRVAARDHIVDDGPDRLSTSSETSRLAARSAAKARLETGIARVEPRAIRRPRTVVRRAPSFRLPDRARDPSSASRCIRGRAGSPPPSEEQERRRAGRRVLLLEGDGEEVQHRVRLRAVDAAAAAAGDALEMQAGEPAPGRLVEAALPVEAPGAEREALLLRAARR